MNNVVAIIQARMSSSRLPGKVLKPIMGRPMLTLLMERLNRATQLDAYLVATSDGLEDDPIEELCNEKAYPCYRGALEDVLDRYYNAARQLGARHIVRITADCPLLDWTLLDKIVLCHLEGGYDYTSNALLPTYPDGLDIEVMTYEALELSWREAKMSSEREHVTQFIQDRPSRFKLKSFQAGQDLSHIRLTVDNPEDFKVVETIYNALYPQDKCFDTNAIITFLKRNPDVLKLNVHLHRNEGFIKSLKDNVEV